MAAVGSLLQRPVGKKPLRGGRQGHLTEWIRADRTHMLSIITWPKPEQLTWVAPSIKRAKS